MNWKYQGAMVGGLGASTLIFWNRFANEWALGTDVSGLFVQPSPLQGKWTGHMRGHGSVPPDAPVAQWNLKVGAYWGDKTIEVDTAGYQKRGGIFIRNKLDGPWRCVTQDYQGWAEGPIGGFRNCGHRRIAVDAASGAKLAYACVIRKDGRAGMIRFDATTGAGLTAFDFDQNRLWCCLGKDPNRRDVLFGAADRHTYGGDPALAPIAATSPGVWAMNAASGARALVRLDPGWDAARTFLVVNEAKQTVIYLSVVSDDSVPAVAGIWRGVVQGPADAVTGCEWTRITGDLDVKSDWESIAGGVRDGRTVLFLGSRAARSGLGGAYPATGRPYLATHVRCLDATVAAPVWEPISGPGQVSFSTFGVDQDWIAVEQKTTAQAGVGGNSANVFDLDYDAVQDVLVSAQKTGPWVLPRAGSTWDAVLWRPLVDGNGAIWCAQVEVHPTDPNRVAHTDVDRSLFTYVGGVPKIHYNGIYGGATQTNQTWCLFIRPNGTILAGREANEVVRNPNPWAAGKWEHYAGVGSNVVGVCEFVDSRARTVRLAMSKDGIFRAMGDFRWTKVSAVGSGGTTRFLCAEKADRVYVLVGSDLMRTDDAGSTWRKVITLPGSHAIARYEREPDTVYLASGNGAWRVDRAGSPSPLATKLGDGFMPKGEDVDSVAVEQSTGRVAVMTQPSKTTAAPGIYVSADRGASWTKVTDHLFEEVAASPCWLAFGDGVLYASTRAANVIRFVEP